MFKLFKKKSPLDKLYDDYEKKMKEAHQLSTSNRSASDAKVAEANEILKKIDQLKAEA
ncbi:MAG: Lacal_2735 family protein [Crocinitomicaceae bacterium]